MRKSLDPQDEADLRTEYSAICANLNQLASFRFTLVGFYVAAIGLIFSADTGTDKFFLLLWISLCFWILKLRNRGLHSNMTARGAQIERDYSGGNYGTGEPRLIQSGPPVMTPWLSCPELLRTVEPEPSSNDQ